MDVSPLRYPDQLRAYSLIVQREVDIWMRADRAVGLMGSGTSEFHGWFLGSLLAAGMNQQAIWELGGVVEWT